MSSRSAPSPPRRGPLERVVLVTDGAIPTRWGPMSARTWIVLAHGAGGTIDDPLTSGVASRLRDRGVGVLETTFAYRAAGRRMPDRMPVLERTLSEVTAELVREAAPLRLALGGKSMGGRVAARIATTVAPLAGVCLLSYPLHPPSKVTAANLEARRETLRALAAPTFVAQGTKDPFGGPEEILRLAPSASVLTVEGGDHDLAVRGVLTEQTLEAIADGVFGLMSSGLRAAPRAPRRSRG